MAWQTHGERMANAWLTHGERTANAWQTHGKRMASAWQTHAIQIWRTHGERMANAWQTHGERMARAYRSFLAGSFSVNFLSPSAHQAVRAELRIRSGHGIPQQRDLSLEISQCAPQLLFWQMRIAFSLWEPLVAVHALPELLLMVLNPRPEPLPSGACPVEVRVQHMSPEDVVPAQVPHRPFSQLEMGEDGHAALEPELLIYVREIVINM